MKILMGTDVEGVAGVVSMPDQSRATGRYYEQTKRLATAEVNAAITGLLAAGAEDVLVSRRTWAGWTELRGYPPRGSTVARATSRSPIGARSLSR